MNRLFSVKTILLISLSILMFSCSTTKTVVLNKAEDEIVSTAVILAEAYAGNKQYDKALEVYNEAYEHADDFRLLYNMSIVYANSGDMEKAFSTAQMGWIKYKDEKIFLDAMLQYALELNDNSKLEFVYKNKLKSDSKDNATRKKLCNIYLEENRKELLLENAMVLWNNNVIDKETVGFLYYVSPEEWQVVYDVINNN